MNIVRLMTLAMAAALAAGCATPEQRAAQMQAEMERQMQIYGPACARLGYASNSDQWRNCVLQLSEREEIERYGPRYHLGYGRSHWRFGGAWGPYW